jgi:hypothetical protein
LNYAFTPLTAALNAETSCTSLKNMFQLNKMSALQNCQPSTATNSSTAHGQALLLLLLHHAMPCKPPPHVGRVQSAGVAAAAA